MIITLKLVSFEGRAPKTEVVLHVLGKSDLRENTSVLIGTVLKKSTFLGPCQDVQNVCTDAKDCTILN